MGRRAITFYEARTACKRSFKMNEPYEYVKSLVVNFKLNNCCYIAPVKVGLLITAYFNIIFDLASIVGMADESYSPTIMQVEEKILEDNATKPIPILCYSAEFAFNSVLLCAVYRKDLQLMRVYMYFCVAATITSVLFYSVVIVSLGALMKITLILSIIYQFYVLLLVRSAIVEMKLAQKVHLPTLVMSSLVQEAKEPQTATESDVETPPENDPESTTEPNEETKNNEDKKHDTKLETVDENPKVVH